MAGLRSRRPRSAEEFIAEAGEPLGSRDEPVSAPMPEHVLQSPDAHKRSDSSKDLLPWEEGWVRAEVVKVFNLRLPEPYKLKLDWLRAQTRVPTHELLLGLVLPGIDREIVRVRTQSDQRKKLPSSSSHE